MADKTALITESPARMELPSMNWSPSWPSAIWTRFAPTSC